MAKNPGMNPAIQAAIRELTDSCIREDSIGKKIAVDALRSSFATAFRQGWSIVNSVGALLGSELLRLEPHNMLACLQLLTTDPAHEMRALAARVAGHIGQEYPEDIVPIAYRLAADENWEVREVIANALDDLISPGHPDFLFQLMNQWSMDSDPNIRRVPTNALMRFGRQHPHEVLSLMAELRHDDSDYVRRNVAFCLQQSIGKIKHPILGPAVPGGPQMLLDNLGKWAKELDWRPRWIVATTLGNVWAKDFIEPSLIILEQLAGDTHTQVQTAVINAFKTLAKSNPEEVRTMLGRLALSEDAHTHKLAERVTVKLI